MSVITFDTHKFVKELRASGVPEQQAEAFVRAQQEILSQVLDSTLASKSDIDRIERKMVEHDGRFGKLEWMMGALIAVAIANFAKQFF